MKVYVKDEFWSMAVTGELVKLQSKTLRAAKIEAWKGKTTCIVMYSSDPAPYVHAYRFANASTGETGKWVVCPPFRFKTDHFQPFVLKNAAT